MLETPTKVGVFHVRELKALVFAVFAALFILLFVSEYLCEHRFPDVKTSYLISSAFSPGIETRTAALQTESGRLFAAATMS
jgi:hypothetical protein